MSKKPVLTIGLPVYNGEAYLREAVDSLLAQDFSNFELIISDNGSSDGTQQLCQEYALKDVRVKYLRHDINRGATWNFNYVFKQTSAPYFMWAAHDDYWQPSYLKSCVDIIQRSESIVLVSSFCDCVDVKTGGTVLMCPGVDTVGLRVLVRFKRYKRSLHSPVINVNAMFYGVYRHKVLKQLMPLKTKLAADHLLLAELSLWGEFVIIDRDLMNKRYGGASSNMHNAARALQINNPVAFRYPQLVREINLQTIIFQTERLRFWERIYLSLWSWSNFFRCSFLNRMGTIKTQGEEIR